MIAIELILAPLKPRGLDASLPEPPGPTPPAPPPAPMYGRVVAAMDTARGAGADRIGILGPR